MSGVAAIRMGNETSVAANETASNHARTVIGSNLTNVHRTIATGLAQRTAMAIGSNPEIGKSFTLWGEKTPQEQQAWWEYMRTEWHPYLMKGYATLVHNKNNPYYQGRK